MKLKLTLLFFIIACRVVAQHHLPVVKANSNKAKFHEGNMAVYNWYIDPAVKTDVFTSGKLTRVTNFVFKTDIDSISFKLKPGQQKDFIVLLNGRDSCLTRIQSPELKNYSASANAFHDTVAFKINKYNTNYVPVVINGTDSILLNFDTGATDVCIISESLKNKIKAKLKLYNTPYAISIGSKDFKSKIYDITTVGHEVDGLLGWDIFDGMVVELDYDKQKMIIHSAMPKHLTKDKGYEKFNITYIRNKPFIESNISQGSVTSKSLFFFDLGYQRAAMLDNDVLVNAKFPVEKTQVIKKVIMHGSRGNEIPVITAALQDLQIGKFRLKNVPAQIMIEGKPLPGTNVHYLGSDILKRFNTVLDFQHNAIYLKPNSYYNAAFADQAKDGA
ncbi:pepsin/retropepsin-like aspartic protease family protein [Mucilaginibacter aquatilis]|uniref:Aspartyl protease n=1 Tax=Mucilaginibacter aquatilis TaxID=1517760 RepID=A0A6I4ICY2_9SPHI|nr:hypothetical protein [Mucilaginibacter aquatilis]MVN93022.1 hypothetical protein [Mucilaginibacter aquatilis]